MNNNAGSGLVSPVSDMSHYGLAQRALRHANLNAPGTVKVHAASVTSFPLLACSGRALPACWAASVDAARNSLQLSCSRPRSEAGHGATVPPALRRPGHGRRLSSLAAARGKNEGICLLYTARGPVMNFDGVDYFIQQPEFVIV